MDIQTALTNYTNDLNIRQCSPAHQKTVAYRITRFINDHPTAQINQITDLDLARHFSKMRQTRTDGTMAGLTATHRAFWKFCCLHGYITQNPAARLRSYTYTPNVRTPAPESSIATLIAAIPQFIAHRNQNPRDVRDALFCAIAIDSGARRGAILALRTNEARTSIQRGRPANGRIIYEMWAKRGKTGAAKILFGEETAQILTLWLRLAPPSDHLFCNVHTAAPLNPDVAGRIIPRLCQFANIPPIRTHAIRKRNVTNLATDPEIAQRYAGHKNLSTTLLFYRDKRESDVDTAVASLATQRHGDSNTHQVITQLFQKRS